MAAAASGGVPPLRVEVQITTTGAKAAANSMQQVTRASNNMTRGFGAGVISTRTLGDAMRMSASLMKYTVAGAFMSVGKAAIQAYRNFELSFSRIKGLVGISSDAIEKMKKGVLEMATETTRGPEELAEALYFVTSSGIRDASTAMSILKASARASASGLGETKVVADAVTSAMNAYGLSMMTASRATDVITAAVREGKAEADTMAPAFSKVLPVASAFGASFEDVAAAMAALSRSGMTAGTAGIYVRQVLSQLLKPSKQAREALSAVGTSAEDIRKQVQEQGLFAALQNLSNRLGGIENAGAFAKVFGNVRALTAVLQLVGPAAAENAEIFERLQNSTGDTADAFDAYTDTLDKKFNQALTAQRVALIELGESIKPLATLLLDVSTAISGLTKSLLGFKIRGQSVVGILAALAGGLALMVAGAASAMQTTSAIIRLVSNLSITLRGTGYMYDATTQKLYKLNIAKNKNKLATHQATLAMNGYTAASTKAGIAMGFLAKNAGHIGRILSIIAIGATIFSMFRNKTKQAGEETDSMAKSVANINELLDETVKYGKSDLLFNVGIQVKKSRLEQDMDRLFDEINQQSPSFFENLKRTYNTAGNEVGVIFAQALLSGAFGGVTGASQEVLLGLFAKQLGVDPKLISEALIPEITGDLVADAIINKALIGAATANERTAAAIGTGTFKEMNDAITEGLTTTPDGDVFEPYSRGLVEGLTEFGRGFTDVIKEQEGNIVPLIEVLKLMDKEGTLTAATLEMTLGTALSGLTGGLELQAAKAGNLFEIFKKPENKSALINFIRASIPPGSGDPAVIYADIAEQISKIPKGANRSVEALRIFSTSMGQSTVQSKKFDAEQQKIIDSLSSQQQLLKDIISEYESQVSVMKDLEKAQRGLLGITLTQEEAQRDLMDQYQKTGEAIQKSKGDFSMETESGRKSRAELQKNAEAVMALANTYAAAGDTAGAAEVFTKGIGEILSVASQAGGEKAALATAGTLKEMGFTGEMYRDSLLAAETVIDAPSTNLGKNVAEGIAKGISSATGTMSEALVSALKSVVVTSEEAMGVKSPSRVTAKAIGKPMAEGVEVGFTKYASSSKFKNAITKTLNKSVEDAYKAGGRKGVSKFFENFLERKKAVETPAQDFVKATIGRMKDIIGSLSNYINSQLNFRKAQADLAKLINMQRGLDDRRRKAAREQQFSETRFGREGGAEVTGYEQAQIDELQLAFERVSRDYAMGRASYVDLVDAEIALFEARAAASEINDDVINSQNAFIDATVEVENRNLELASATVNVLESYQDVQEAAAQLYMNHKELADVYNHLARVTGIATGKLTVGNSELTNLGQEVQLLGGYSSTVGGYMSTLGNNMGITGQTFKNQFEGPGGIFSKIVKTGGNITTLTNDIGASFTNLSRGLLDPDSQFMKDIKSLPSGMWEAIKVGAQEAVDKSPLKLKISVNAVVDSSGSGSFNFKVTTPTPTTVSRPSGQYIPGYGGIGENPILYAPGKAVGGPVSAMKPYMVGERGPEMFLPKVSGTIVTTSALERYTRNRQTGISQSQASQNNISVIVNNPVPEAAQDSITRRMKVLSNSGLFG